MEDLFQKIPKNDLEQLISDNTNPSVFTFISPFSGKPISVPIWIYMYENRFYIFTGKNSHKVKAIEKGNNDVNILIIDRNSFPIVTLVSLPYVSITGKANIVKWEENQNISNIHIKLLEKYNVEGQDIWIGNLIEKIRNKPENTWMIEITPNRVYTFNG